MNCTAVSGRGWALPCSAAVLGGVLALVMAGLGRDARAEDRPPDTASLSVRTFSATDNPKLVMVTLLANGKAVRSRQLDSGWFTGEKTDKEVTWDKLPVGPYELQFQADGYEKSVYQIALSKEDKEFKVGVPMMKRTGIGDDPAFRHLAERVTKLEAANTELRGTVARLQKEFDQLKKK